MACICRGSFMWAALLCALLMGLCSNASAQSSTPAPLGAAEWAFAQLSEGEAAIQAACQRCFGSYTANLDWQMKLDADIRTNRTTTGLTADNKAFTIEVTYVDKINPPAADAVNGHELSHVYALITGSAGHAYVAAVVGHINGGSNGHRFLILGMVGNAAVGDELLIADRELTNAYTPRVYRCAYDAQALLDLAATETDHNACVRSQTVKGVTSGLLCTGGAIITCVFTPFTLGVTGPLCAVTVACAVTGYGGGITGHVLANIELNRVKDILCLATYARANNLVPPTTNYECPSFLGIF